MTAIQLGVPLALLLIAAPAQSTVTPLDRATPATHRLAAGDSFRGELIGAGIGSFELVALGGQYVDAVLMSAGAISWPVSPRLMEECFKRSMTPVGVSGASVFRSLRPSAGNTW